MAVMSRKQIEAVPATDACAALEDLTKIEGLALLSPVLAGLSYLFRSSIVSLSVLTAFVL